MTADDELPDTKLFWRWVGRATRPVVGWVLVAVGALMILGGYLGVANQVLVAKQLPYLVSGGLLGVAVVIVGVLFLGTEEIRNDSGRLDRLERMVDELHAVLLSHPDAPSLAPAGGFVSHPELSAAPSRLVALPDGERYHTEECAVVAGKTGVSGVSASTISRRSLTPCPLCEPEPVGG